MSRRYDAVIFDWAGTTVDYGSFAPVQAFAEAFQAHGIVPTLQELRGPMGLPKLDHIRAMFSMDRISKLWEKQQGRSWKEEDAERVFLLSEEIIMGILSDFAAPKPYVARTVKELREMGIKIGSTTGYTAGMMEIVASKAASLGYAPDCWFCPDDVNGKGRP